MKKIIYTIIGLSIIVGGLFIWQKYETAKAAPLSSARNHIASAPRTGLVGWWTMDANDINGSVIYDKSGGNASSTGINVTSADLTQGKINQAFDIDGSSERIMVSDANNLDVNSFTASVWMKGSVISGQNALVSKWGITGQSSYLFDLNGGLLRLILSQDGTNNASINTATNALVAGRWYHVVVVYSASAQTVVFYVDGSVAASSLTSGAVPSSLKQGTDAVNIGSSTASATGLFTGSIDDVRIYNRALTAQEVSNLYNAAKTNYVATPVKRTGLVLDLNFGNNNGAAAPTVYDTSGNGRNATSTAGATSPTCGGKFCDFDGGDVMGVNTAGVFDSSVTNLSFAIKFSPDFAGDSGIVQGIFMADPSAYAFYIRKGNANLQIAFNNEAVIVQATAVNYAQYWKTGKENVLIFSGTSGSNKVWLNGNPITLVSATGAWTLPNTTWGDIGSGGGGIRFDGKLHYLKVWNRLLTDDEVATISADRRTYLK